MANGKRLIEWIKNGDPDKVPILFGSHKDIVASYLKVKPDELTGRQIEEEAVKMGIEAVNSLGCFTLFDAVPFCEDIKITEKEETLPNGTIRTFRTISAPKGTLSDVREKPLTWEAAPKECMVKSEADMPAFEYFVRSTARAAIEEPGYRKELIRKGMEKKKEMSKDTATVWGTWTPAFELMCTNFFMSDMAIYILYDYTTLFEELMEIVWEKDRKTLLPVGLELGADLFMTAINGLEWFSPSIYEKYLIPQGKRLFDWSSANNNLSWLHTCGRMNVLINSGVYDTLRPDILESLSSPPPGDIRDLRSARTRLGHDMTTKGCLNVEVIYSGTADEVKKEVNRILDCTKGYKHILADTNSHFYGDPPENIKAVIDTVAERGQSLN